MADREYAEELNAKADAMLEKYCKLADETFDSVLGRTEIKIKKEKNWQEQNPVSPFGGLEMLYYHETGMSMTGFIII